MGLGKHTLTGLSFSFLVILVLGILSLSLSAASVPSYSWGGTTPSGGLWDAWGVRLYPQFFIYYPLALFLLTLSMIFYPILMYVIAKHRDVFASWKTNFMMILGLLIPVEFVFGDPITLIHGGGRLGVLFYRILSPIYTFSIGWAGGFWITPSFLGLAYFGILVWLFLYKEGMINYQLFVIPFILIVIVTIIQFVQIILLLSTSYIVFPSLWIPTHSFPLGVFIFGENYNTNCRHLAFINKSH